MILKNIYFIDIIKYLLYLFIVGLLTISNILGLSNITIVFGLMVTGFYIFYVVVQKTEIQYEVIIYLIWIAWSTSGYFLAKDLPIFMQTYFTILQIGVLLFVISGYTGRTGNIAVTMFGIISGVLIVLTLTITSGEVFRVLESGSHLRLAGIVDNGNANSFSQYMLYGVFSVFLLWNDKKSIKFFLMFVFFTCLVGIILSGSRQGLIGIVSFLIFWFLFNKFRLLLKRPAITISVLLIIMLSGYFAMEYILANTYMGTRLTDSEQVGSDDTRMAMYIKGFEILSEHPILGVGLNQYAKYSRSRMYSHSDYIEVASNTGIVGFILYFSVYAILIARLKRMRKLYKNQRESLNIGIMLASIITILILGFIKPNIQFKLTWVYLGSVIGYSWALMKRIHIKGIGNNHV